MENRENPKRALGVPISKFIMGDSTASSSRVPVTDETILKFFSAVEQENEMEMQEMINSGFNLDSRNASGITPLHYACDKEKEEAVKFLLNHYTDVNMEDEDGMTPLHYAVLCENEEMIEGLIKKGADLNKKDKDGISPLDQASKRLKQVMKELAESKK